MAFLLKVTVVEARGIHIPAMSLSADIFAVVTYNGKTVNTGPCTSHDKEAMWDEYFEFPLLPNWAEGSMMNFQLYHRGMINDRPIGNVTLPIGYLLQREGWHDCRFFDLTKVDDAAAPAGQLKLELQVVKATPMGQPGMGMMGVPMGMGMVQFTQQSPQMQPPPMGRSLSAPMQQQSLQRQPPPPDQQKAVEIRVGEVLDNKYHVQRLLGKGNFGTAYLATSEVDDQRYAVKLILCKRDSELQTIKTEAKILFQMLHDNIVRYFSSFIHIDHLGQRYYAMVMEYCENCDIQTHIQHYKKKQTRGSDRRIARWTLEIAQALAYMHAKGLQHRDLKADNVMVSDEKAKVADFGLATTKGSRLGQVGALAYESPEQANHQPYDGRNDIWALGCLVTEMLTGRMVFRRVAPGAVFALQEDVVVSTIAECEAISPDWGRLVSWLLTKEVTLRPTAARVVEILRPIVDEMYSEQNTTTTTTTTAAATTNNTTKPRSNSSSSTSGFELHVAVPYGHAPQKNSPPLVEVHLTHQASSSVCDLKTNARLALLGSNAAAAEEEEKNKEEKNKEEEDVVEARMRVVETDHGTVLQLFGGGEYSFGSPFEAHCS